MVALAARFAVALCLAGPGQPARDYSGDCTDSGCHGDLTRRPVVHGPVDAEACDACHTEADSKEHKFKLTIEEGELCTQCHEEFSGKVVHSPVAEGECIVCHDPHGSKARALLRAPTLPVLCGDCHDDIVEAIDDAETKHGATSAERSCGNCHDAHASDHAHMLVATVRDVCLSCHDKPMETPTGTLADMKLLLEKNPAQHGPVADGDCTACHTDVHGGARFRLLGAAYPRSFYAPYDEAEYELCFDCHDEEAFAEARTDDLTAFRNGDRNLHFLHVARQTKGRTCRACHEVHASRNPHHLADSVPFGRWKLPIGFAPTASGGSCQPGCHRPYRYDRETAVVNIPRAASPSPDS